MLVKKWRASGIRRVMYLDNGIATSECLSESKYHACQIKSDLHAAGFSGFFSNEKESNWIPSHHLLWLGIIIDLNSINYRIPTSKLSKLRLLVESTVNNAVVSARTLARLAGKIMAARLAIGPAATMFTKYFYMAVCLAPYWNFRILLTTEIKLELKFWKQRVFFLLMIQLSTHFDSLYRCQFHRWRG